MTLDKIFVLALGILGIIFTYWFFLGKEERKIEQHERHH